MIKTELCDVVVAQKEKTEKEKKIRRYIDRRISNREIKRAREKRFRRYKVAAATTIFTIIGVLFVFKFTGIVVQELYEQDKPAEQNVYVMRGELQGNCVVLSDGNVHEVDSTYANYTSVARTVNVVLDNNGTYDDTTDDVVINVR